VEIALFSESAPYQTTDLYNVNTLYCERRAPKKLLPDTRYVLILLNRKSVPETTSPKHLCRQAITGQHRISEFTAPSSSVFLSAINLPGKSSVFWQPSVGKTPLFSRMRFWPTSRTTSRTTSVNPISEEAVVERALFIIKCWLRDFFWFCLRTLRDPRSLLKLHETDRGSLLVDFYVPNGFPTFIKRQLQTVPPQLLGDVLLCTVCHDLLTTQRRKAGIGLRFSQSLPGIDEFRAGCFRHHNDLVLLDRSANSGCKLCTQLLDWVSSIRSANDGPAFYPFAIRASLWNTEVQDQFKLVFSLTRHQKPHELTNSNGFYLLELEIFPKGDQSSFSVKLMIIIHRPTFLSRCLRS
jgi:hypothetical protein